MKAHELSDTAVKRAIADQAQAWFILNREREATLEQRSEFLSWLRTSPLHVREYLTVAQLGGDLRAALRSFTVGTDELLAAAREESQDNVIALHAPQSANSPPLTRRAAIAAAASLAIIGALAWWSATQFDAGHKEYRTSHGEQRTVRLDDGSVLHLNSDSAVRIDYSAAERGIAMERGQALFKVAKDAARPFRVRAAGAEVVAVGTEFDVRRHTDAARSEEVVVTVVEGIVTVAHMESAERKAIDVTMAAPVRLTAGQQIRVTRSAPAPSGDKTNRDLRVRAVDVRPAIAWVQQQVMFEREPLADVVSEFNRYGALPIVIEDRDLATLRISGVFNAYDLESFVGYLEQVEGIAVRRDIDRIRISILKTGETL
jgi:transmembrane sensor